MCRLPRNLGAWTFWTAKGLSRPVQGLLYLLVPFMHITFLLHTIRLTVSLFFIFIFIFFKANIKLSTLIKSMVEHNCIKSGTETVLLTSEEHRTELKVCRTEKKQVFKGTIFRYILPSFAKITSLINRILYNYILLLIDVFRQKFPLMVSFCLNHFFFI
jgi:hypothetical protein